MARQGYLFLDACGFEMEARRRNRYLDFEQLRKDLELEFGCVFAEKHYFNSVENPHERNDYHAKLQRFGWTFHLFGYKTVTRRVVRGTDDSFVRFTAEDGSQANPLPGVYEFSVQAGVDSALVTAMSLLHGQAPSSAVFVLIASDADFLSTLSLLRDGGRDVNVVFWEPAATGNSANLAAGLTKFQKPKARQPGETEKYLFLDEILTAPFDKAWECTRCGFSNKAGNAVCGGSGPKGCKGARTEKPESSSEWICECGFKNNAINGVCGGTGQMGCKKPKPAFFSFLPQGVAQADSDGWLVSAQGYQSSEAYDWICECGFRNKQSNVVCGGKGEIGCKRPKPLASSPQQAPAQYVAPVFTGGPSSRQAKGDEWKCAACGFSNNEANVVCGGTGPMGCKAAWSPSEWVCTCGFKNKAINQVCGGRGNVGCKQPRPQMRALGA